MKKLWFIVCSIGLFAGHTFAQAPSIVTRIETLLRVNTPGEKVTVRKAGSAVIIEQSNTLGEAFNFQIPYAIAAYVYTYGTKNGKDTSHRVSIKCADNKDCLTIYEKNVAAHKKAIWLSFLTSADAHTFISLMEELKEEK